MGWHKYDFLIESETNIIGMLQFLIVVLTLTFPQHFVTSQQICPLECMCFDEIEAKCEFDNTTISFPQNLPVEVKFLRIKGGNIGTLLRGDLSRYPVLETLELYKNNLTTIEPFAFVNSTKLHTIIIKKNSLPVLDSYVFANLRRMREIILMGNEMKTIRKLAFDNSTIATVDLRYNFIETIESYAFSNLSEVNNLRLPYNLKTIEKDAFWNLSSVHFVELKFASLKYLSVDMFREMGPISSMLIHDSSIGLIKPKTFSQMIYVKNLEIRKCAIQRIRSTSFADTAKIVTSLHLSANAIDRMENASIAFDNVKLTNNNITCICLNMWLFDKSNWNDLEREKDFMKHNLCFDASNNSSIPFRYVERDFIDKCQQSFNSDADYDENSSSFRHFIQSNLVLLCILLFCCSSFFDL